MSIRTRAATRLALQLGLGVSAVSAVLLFVWPSFAWILHEHTKIGRRAVERLTDGERRTLEEKWREVIGSRTGKRTDYHPNFCEKPGLSSGGRVVGRPKACIDFAMLPSIAADFSCSPAELLSVVDKAVWLPKLLQGAFTTEGQLLAADAVEERLDAWHGDHLRNFEADPFYLERASGNQAHYLLMRTSKMNDELLEYVKASLAADATPNAFAFYVLYHTAALRLAHRTISAPEGTQRRKDLTSALLAEAFALHYLEDAFSSGHIVGTTGGTRERTGTHDFYCEHGVEARSWARPGIGVSMQDSYFAHGDAFLGDDDLDHASAAVRESLSDLLSILKADAPCTTSGCPGMTRGAWLLTTSELAFTEDIASSNMNACKIKKVPAGLLERGSKPDDWVTTKILALTYMPAIATLKQYTPLLGEPELELVSAMPRAQAEMGWFGGFFGSVRYGFGYPWDERGRDATTRFVGTVDAGLEVGISANGITTSSTDALFFLQTGFVAQSAELDAPIIGDARVPDRTGVTLRIRAPFLFVPGDGLLVGPFAATGSRAAKWYLVHAAQQGPWFIGGTHDTVLGGLHIVLGREVGLRWVGHNRWRDFASFGIDLPVFEIKPRTWFADNFATALAWQLGVTADFGDQSHSVGGYLRFAMSARVFPRWAQ